MNKITVESVMAQVIEQIKGTAKLIVPPDTCDKCGERTEWDPDIKAEYCNECGSSNERQSRWDSEEDGVMQQHFMDRIDGI